MIAAIVGLLCVGVTPAAAETLVGQLPGPSGIAVRSDDTSSESISAFDDFVVPVGAHWNLESIQVFGSSASEHPRSFNVKILYGGGGTSPVDIPIERIFTERVTVAGGPNYLIPIEGAPRLDHPNAYEAGNYWISVQALSAGGEDEWSWLTGPDTAGTAPAYTQVEGAEPGLAFQLLGTPTQIVKASSFGAGTIISNPPGISCPGACTAEFPRGTTLTFTPIPAKASIKFTEWGFRNTGFGPFNEKVRIPIPSPCGGTAGCAFTLAQDTNVGAIFDPIDEVTVLQVLHDRRTGRGELLVQSPGEGVLSMTGPGLRFFAPGTVAAGVIRVPLIPTRRIAKALHKKGHVTVGAKVEFRAIEAISPGATQVRVTLVRKRSRHLAPPR